MSTNTLEVAYANGDIIDASHINELTLALLGSVVGRDANGIPTPLQSLGTLAIPWGTSYITNLILNGSAVDASLLTAPQNRIISGQTRATSDQPQFIKPNGAAASFILEATTTNLILDIDGVAVTASADVTKSGLTVGPSTTATCLVDDTSAADGIETRTAGEYGAEDESIIVDTMGAEFQAFIGQMVAIKIAGVSTEYALAFVKSATELTNVFRGYFTDSADTPINRTAYTNNDVITVLSTGWIFIEDDGSTIDVSYITPVQSFTAPTGPAAGDYWKDLSLGVWKRYDGASWQVISRTLIGVVGIDSANCVCARSFDFYAKYDSANSIETEINSTSVIDLKNIKNEVNILGNKISFDYNKENWNITTDLAPATDMYNATEQSSTVYYLYIAGTGETIISDISPHYRPDLRGAYHPHNPWRCIAEYFNNSGSDFTTADSNYFVNTKYNKNIEFNHSYSAQVASSSGTAVVNNISEPWFTSVVRTAPGQVTYDYTKLGLKNSPTSVQATAQGYTGNVFSMLLTLTATAFVTVTDSDGGSALDADNTVTMHLSETDIKAFKYWNI